MKKRKWIILLLGIFFLTGCDATGMNPPSPFSTNTNYETASQPMDKSYSDGYTSDQQVSYTGYATAETKSFDDDNKQLLALVESKKGIMKSQNSYQYYDGTERRHFTQADYAFDIPQDQFDSFVKEAKDAFVFSRFNVTSSDMTGSLTDTQSRIDTVKEEIKRVEDLLKDPKTNNTEKITLEAELRTLNEEKTNLENQLTATQDSVAYSSIQFSLKEVPRYYNESPDAFFYFRQAFSGFFGYAIWLLAISLRSLFFVIPYLIVGVFTYIVARKLTQKFVHKGKEKYLVEKKKDNGQEVNEKTDND